ncbi:asparaginase [Paraburkholderia rhizosphaerae]|uniref:Glutamin-(Asparagin-)ase n=1 Tax=Paraburkholderia rhizosphaerae TaxID=480658 RepID=A0A4R8LHR0_9BURK|nr:asparaginase [Paraburkholderia rhizosphaerae]TDY42763.1 glutamin-(asparagin-)ase [Paraburkholderia rhizosphaerae]
MKANIAIIGTGGTIAGRGESSVNTSAYACSVVSVDEILSGIPELASLANLQAEQLLQMGSENFATEHLLLLGSRISRLLQQDHVDGVVVTHGTDTIDETAYFLHLTLKSMKPVVVVGSMRPPSALSPDGPLNLYNAILVASSPASRGKGTLVVSNDEIHTARDVVKTSTFKLESFRSPYGPLGYVVEGMPRYYREPARSHTLETPWSIEEIDRLPEVGIVYAHGGIDAGMVDAVTNARMSGIVYAATGNGNVAEHVVGALLRARREGLHVVRASRTGSGVVIRNGAQPDDKYDWLVVDDQAPQKARILLMLALTREARSAELQRMFHRY